MENINKLEVKKITEDNARKFTLGDIDPEFLKKNTVVSYTLVIDWIGITSDEDRKLAYKKFEDGKVQILDISKVGTIDNRITQKTSIDEEKYKELLKLAKAHIEKKRYEINYIQNENPFVLKYDEITGSSLRILEVDAVNEEIRSSFKPQEFPCNLLEVTGDQKFYGHRITEII